MSRRAALFGQTITGFEKEFIKGYADVSLAVLELEEESVIRKDRLKIVIAGAGMVIRYHIAAWKKLPRVEIAAIMTKKGGKSNGYIAR